MKQFVLFIVFLSVLQKEFAQPLLPIQYDTTYESNELILSGNVEFGSTAIKNEMLKKFIYGGLITDRIKTNSFTNQGLQNIVGFEANSEIEYRNYKINLFKNPAIGLLVKGGYTSIGAMTFTKDAYGLAFYGNSNYFSQKAELSGTSVKFTTFQKFGLGLIFKKSKSTITFNYFNIENYLDCSIMKGFFKQNNDGSNDSLRLSSYVSSSNTPKFNAGYGFGVDVDLKIKIDWTKDQTAYIQLKAVNLGFATIHTGTTTYVVDSSYHVQGFKIRDLIDQETVLSDSDIPIYSQLGIEKSNRKTNFFLPCMFQAGKIVDDYFPHKLQTFFGFRLYPNISYTPMVYGGLHFKVNSKIAAGIQESYGGFTKFRTGIYFHLNLKKITGGLATENIIGLFSKKGNGQSLILRLQWKI